MAFFIKLIDMEGLDGLFFGSWRFVSFVGSLTFYRWYRCGGRVKFFVLRLFFNSLSVDLPIDAALVSAPTGPCSLGVGKWEAFGASRAFNFYY